MDDLQLQENGLADAASGYLRSARHQPVDWHPWGAEAFARATRENKPVLLDVGATWCHWCHVMDRESYEDPLTADVINKLYIAIKVDRDERPDVDTRYQAAVSAISGQGGWPLTAFLTPDGRPYFGGTYFPPDERYGQPSFQRVLLTMAEAFNHRRDEVEESAGSVMLAIEESESFNGHSGVANAALLEKLITAPLQQFDERNGGFGSQPKFPHPAVLDLLLDASAREGTNAARARHVAIATLDKMAAGGMYDHLAGGFHRYSVDDHWRVPHFEKMAYDNSELLKSYVHAWQASGEERHAAVARDILRWMDEWLSDRELGGFYASQDADASLDDDGDYFTWTRAEAATVLSEAELEAATDFYNLRAVGDMHHNPQKNVLHRLALGSGLNPLQASARRKLYEARLQRPAPHIDRTMYTGWNAMCISAYLLAGRVLELPQTTAFALKSLDRVLAAAWSSDGLSHIVAYNEGPAVSSHIAAVLDDYAMLCNAALDAWEATAELRYFTAAQEIVAAMLQRLCDFDEGGATCRGFFDTQPDPRALGALGTRRKPLQDSPTPSGNAMAATALLRLHMLTGNDRYRSLAMSALETFAGIVEHFGLYAASFGLALRRALEPPVQVSILGDDALAIELAAAALKTYAVERIVIRVTQQKLTALPPALAHPLPHLPPSEGSIAIVCRGGSCLSPISSAEGLLSALA